MLVFRNPGLIDLEAIRTLGVSVKQPGSFGRFGTGLKFALATILRGGGEITVFRGLNEHRIGSVEKEIRGTLFQIVTLDEEPIGFTTELGKDWEPWMVLRELGCNALDETGSFGSTLSSVYETFIDPMPAEDSTVILVTWEALETAYRQRKELFLEGTELWKNDDLRILSGPSSHIFYRGIRVFKLEKPTLFTYDILAEQILTEDRTLSSLWRFNGLLRDAFYSMKDSTLIGQALTTSSGYHEHSIDYGDVSYGVKSSKEFIDAAHQAREAKKLTSESAKKVLLKSIRSSTEETSTFGSYRRVVDDSFSYAIEQLGSLGMKFTETQSFVILDELSSEGTLSMIEDGRIYILRDLTKRPAREIAGELLKRWVDLNIDGYGMDDAVTLLTPFLLGKLKTMKEDEALVKEDETLFSKEEDELAGVFLRSLVLGDSMPF